MTGPKPKPTALKLLQGNPGKRGLNKNEPKPQRGAPDKPGWLTELASSEWDHIVPLLLNMGVLATADGAALANYCQSYARMIQAEAEIDRVGIVVEIPILNKEQDVVGWKLRKNPAVTAALAEKKEMRAALGLFGLDPSSRTRLTGGSVPQPISELGALLQAQAARRSVQREKANEALRGVAYVSG